MTDAEIEHYLKIKNGADVCAELAWRQLQTSEAILALLVKMTEPHSAQPADGAAQCYPQATSAVQAAIYPRPR